MSKSKCPTPRKQRYPSRGAAEAAMRKMPQPKIDGTGMLYVPARAYRCRCGNYHLSARPRPFRKL